MVGSSFELRAFASLPLAFTAGLMAASCFLEPSTLGAACIEDRDCLKGTLICDAGVCVPGSGIPPEDDFQCSDGSTIYFRWQCDGVADCPDGGDEDGCTPFQCFFAPETVPRARTCDGAPDCDDASDEIVCSIICNNDNLVLWTWICDGVDDCGDGSDENPGFCLTCDGGVPLAPALVCDGGPDCGDQSDEADCQTMTCLGGDTIPAGYQCDGTADCASDDSDERGCYLPL